MAAEAEQAVENEDGITGMAVPPVYAVAGASGRDYQAQAGYESASGRTASTQPGEPGNSPYAGKTVSADLNAELHNAEFYAPTSIGTLTEERSGLLPPLREQSNGSGASGNGWHGAESHAPGVRDSEPLSFANRRSGQVADSHQQDVAEAVSVAAAYFEDTLSTAPQRVWSAGPMGADALRRALQVTGVGGDDGFQVRELVEPAALLSEAVSASVPRCWLTGVVGALRS